MIWGNRRRVTLLLASGVRAEKKNFREEEEEFAVVGILR
jgi:hypothetical protein